MFVAWDLQFLCAVLYPYGDCLQFSAPRWEGRSQTTSPSHNSADLLALCGHNAGVAGGGVGIAWGACLEREEGKEGGEGRKKCPLYEMGEGR